MKTCHVCMAECGDDAELCPVCGADLLAARETQEDEQPETVIENPVLAASVEDVVTAEIYRDVLRENGIPFSCDEPDSDASMKVLFGGGFVTEDIYVDETDLARAEALYNEVLNAEPAFDGDFTGEFEEAFEDEADGTQPDSEGEL